MLWHRHDYSSAPVSPVSPSPYIRGRGAVLFGAGASAGQAAQAEPERGIAPGPSAHNNVRLRGASAEELAAAVKTFEEKEASLVHERAYAAMGRNPQASAFTSASGELPLAFASVQSAAFSGAVQADAAPLHEGGGASGAEAAEPEAVDDSSRIDSAQLSGGREIRSAKRNYAGGSSSGRESGGEGAREKGGSGQGGALDGELGEEERRIVAEMEKRDQEVRRHEQAHLSAGAGVVAGGASYETSTGPDGRQYAVGGEVQIDTSEGANPEASIAKARKIRSAALAPAEPSGQDRLVAAKASQLEREALQEKREQEAALQQGALDGAEASGSAQSAGRRADSLRDRERSFMNKAAGAYARASGALPPTPHGRTLSAAV